jgi:hypothetical protein
VDWSAVLLAVLGGLLLLWAALLVLLWLTRPADLTVREALRLLPDLVRLVRRLAADSSLPRGVRIRLWLLLGYLLSPVDLVPDVNPCSTTPRVWPGRPVGLAVVQRLPGLSRARPRGRPGRDRSPG